MYLNDAEVAVDPSQEIRSFLASPLLSETDRGAIRHPHLCNDATEVGIPTLAANCPSWTRERGATEQNGGPRNFFLLLKEAGRRHNSNNDN